MAGAGRRGRAGKERADKRTEITAATMAAAALALASVSSRGVGIVCRFRSDGRRRTPPGCGDLSPPPPSDSGNRAEPN